MAVVVDPVPDRGAQGAVGAGRDRDRVGPDRTRGQGGADRGQVTGVGVEQPGRGQVAAGVRRVQVQPGGQVGLHALVRRAALAGLPAGRWRVRVPGQHPQGVQLRPVQLVADRRHLPDQPTRLSGRQRRGASVEDVAYPVPDLLECGRQVRRKRGMRIDTRIDTRIDARSRRTGRAGLAVLGVAVGVVHEDNARGDHRQTIEPNRGLDAR